MVSKIKFWQRLAASILLTTLAACQLAPIPNAGVTKTSNPPPAASQIIKVKITTEKPGYFLVQAEDLRMLGLEIEGFDPAITHLYGIGSEQEFWIEGVGRKSSLGFYAAGFSNRYSDDGVYWLVLGATQLEEIDGCGGESHSIGSASEPVSIQLPEGAYAASVNVEENRLYQPQAEGGDHWFGASLPAPQSARMDVVLDSLASGAGGAHLSLWVWSNTEAALTPDHHLAVIINGQNVADESWEGKGWHTLEAEFPAGLLVDGENQFQIQAVGDLQIAADIYQIDRLRLTYPRKPEAQNDALDFWQPKEALQLGGFSGPVQILDITNPYSILRVADNYDSSSEFSGEIGHHYYAFGAGGSFAPELALAENTLDLHKTGLAADYIAIGPPDLLQPLQPLLELREEQGLKTLAVPSGEVYDQFSCGVTDPRAVQEFVQYASEDWERPPKYLLLVGDASYDPKGYITSNELNRLPTFLVDTVFGGETASDVGFVQLNDDPWPDLPIGRLPASTPEQIRIIVQKILDYEQGSSRSNRLVAIADGQEKSFRGDAQAFLDLFPDEYSRELFAPPAGDTEANQEIRQLMTGSNLLVAYFGHGSVNMWGKDRLFTTEDVKALTKAGQLPVVINLTCLTGLFTHPKVESLAESLLWKPDGGAVAVLAPSSLTLPTDQSFLSGSLAQALIENPEATLGELHLQARRQVSLDTAGAMDVMQTFMLFGDPAMRLAFPGR